MTLKLKLMLTRELYSLSQREEELVQGAGRRGAWRIGHGALGIAHWVWRIGYGALGMAHWA